MMRIRKRFWKHWRIKLQESHALVQNVLTYRFLLVKFQLDYILDFPEAQDAVEALESLPTDMESAYREIMKRIENAKTKTLSLKVLSWVLHARRPLRIDELREA